ncbi:hypothetical protein HK405_011388, partial [Cladochytrium tenue]
VIDTAVLYPIGRAVAGSSSSSGGGGSGSPRKHSLQYLAERLLGRKIQAGAAAGHDSREDAVAALELALLFHKKKKEGGFIDYL